MRTQQGGREGELNALLEAAHNLFRFMEVRLDVELSPADQRKDLALKEAVRRAAFGIRQWREGNRQASDVVKEMNRVAEVLYKAKDPIYTREDLERRMGMPSRGP